MAESRKENETLELLTPSPTPNSDISNSSPENSKPVLKIPTRARRMTTRNVWGGPPPEDESVGTGMWTQQLAIFEKCAEETSNESRAKLGVFCRWAVCDKQCDCEPRALKDSNFHFQDLEDILSEMDETVSPLPDKDINKIVVTVNPSKKDSAVDVASEEKRKARKRQRLRVSFSDMPPKVRCYDQPINDPIN